MRKCMLMGWLGAAALLVLAPPVAAQGAFARHLPEDTLSYVAVNDLQQARSAFEASDLGRMLADPEVRAFFETLMAGMDRPLDQLREAFKKETGLELDDVLSIVVKRFGVANTGIDLELMDAQKAQARAWYEMQDIAYGAESFLETTGRLPASLNDLLVDPGIEGWVGPYLWKKTTPVDPWGNDYRFQMDEAGLVVVSYGADGEAGGDGANADLVSTERPVKEMPFGVVVSLEVTPQSTGMVHSYLERFLEGEEDKEFIGRRNEQPFDGWKLSRSDGSIYLIWREGHFVLATNAASYGVAVGVLDGKPGGLATREGFAAFAQRFSMGNTVVEYWADVTGALSQFPSMPEKAQRFLDESGLLGVEALGAGFGMDGGQFTVRLAVQAPTPRKGLVALIAGGGGGSLTDVLDRVPPSADAVSRTEADLVGAWDMVMELARKMAPPQDMERGLKQLARLEEELGVSIRDDLLAPMSGEVVSFMAAPPGGGLMPDNVTLWKMADPARFEASLARLAGPDTFELKSLEYQGSTLRYLAATVGDLGENPFEQLEGGIDGPQDLLMALGSMLSGGTFCVQDGVVVLSRSAQTVKRYVSWYQTENRASMADIPGIGDFLEEVPAGAGFVTISDGRRPFAQSYNTLLPILQMFEGTARRAGVPLELALLPPAEDLARHVRPALSYSVTDELGIRWHLQLGSPMSGMLMGTSAVAIIAAIAIPNLISARSSANESSAIGTLRALNNAQGLYQQRDMDGNGTADYAQSLEALVELDLADPLVLSEKSGYVFHMADATLYSFTIVASPVEPGTTGDRYFVVRQDGVIRFSLDPDIPFGEWRAIE